VLAYTRSAAFANHTDKKLGTLEAGKLADLAVLSKDIFSLPHEEIGTAKVSATMVGGKIVYGKLQ
jgi:predicted amidohydrolase YtcJ